MTVAVDASVAVKWLLPEPDSPQAETLLSGGNRLVAPDLLLIEVANVLWRKRRAAQVTDADAAAMQEDLPQFFARLHPIGPLMPRALAISFALDHPVYDCVYLALAEREGCPLVTADARFLAKAARFDAAELVSLADFAPDIDPEIPR